MNLSNSACSSGCESGWTIYFNGYSDSNQDQYHRVAEEETLRSKGEYLNDDKDLSMVSDASSGPPHLHEDENCFIPNEYICYTSDQTKVRQNKRKEWRGDEEKSNLDDTASSPFVNLSKEKSAYRKHSSFLKTSVKGEGV